MTNIVKVNLSNPQTNEIKYGDADKETLMISKIKKLYHGTDKEFDTFDLSKAKKFKDFGKGFYLTTDFSQAQKWAQRKGYNNSKAYIYCYEVKKTNDTTIKVLELLQYNQRWLDFICQSRIDGKESDYDIIYDRIADNQYSEISNLLHDYREKKKSCDEVIDMIKWTNTKADQYCFKSIKSLSLLERVKVIVQNKASDGRWLQER